MRNPIKVAILDAIGFYQRNISPACGPRCRYHPTCSAYAASAITIHGVTKGSILAIWRLLRCNQFSRGGVDYPPDPGRWRPDPWVYPNDDHDSSEKPTKID